MEDKEKYVMHVRVLKQALNHGLVLTLFRMGGVKRPPTSFSPLTSTNVRISLQNVLNFSFNPFDRLL